MANLNPRALWQRFINLSNDSLAKTLIMAFSVALVSAVVVSVTAVSLKPIQDANLELRRQARMQDLILSLPGMAELLQGSSDGGAETSLEVKIVDFAGAWFATDIDSATYDQRAATTDPDLSIALSDEEDIAGLGRRANYAPVYMLLQDEGLALIILPVNGIGYQSTIYGYLALEGNLTTIAGFTVYEQGETPGLGSRIEEPEWEALWPGKEIANAEGEIIIEVVRGEASGPFQVDGISGATRTSNGVTKLLQFWLGDHGYGPFLTALKAGGI